MGNVLGILGTTPRATVAPDRPHASQADGRVPLDIIEDAATGAPVARFPVPLDHISTFRNGRAWVGANANHLYIITLEGGEDSSKPKAESAKPDGE
jgi:hypothetical protein